MKPRTIIPMKACTVSNIYQIHEQRGSHLGSYTCGLIKFGNFGFCSPLLDESESRSIINRPNINSLLDKLKMIMLYQNSLWKYSDKERENIMSNR